MNRNLFPIRQALFAATLAVAAPLAAAEQPAARYFDEPVWSEFVYEKIGATPSIRLDWFSAKPAQAAAKPAVVAARDSDAETRRAASAHAEKSDRTGQPATVAVVR